MLDANVGTNPKVQKAQRDLVRQLQHQKAVVRLVELPMMDGVNGADDYVARVGDDQMAALIDQSRSASTSAGNKPGSQTQQLLKLSEGVQLFHTPDGQPYAAVDVDGHTENLSIEGSRFRLWLRREYHNKTGAAPRPQVLQDVVNTLASGAVFDAPEVEVFLRVAGLDDRIFIDVGDRQWSAIEISPNGWRVIHNPAVRFRRAEGMLPLPRPEENGCLNDLRTFVNVTDENDWRLIIAYLLQSFRPDGPYPILILNGEHGSAKTTCSKVLRELLDPNKATHSGPPADVRDVAIAATNQWIVALDNLSFIPNWLSDALCRVATGGGLRTRRLYTDAEETILEVQRPAILNGIEQLATRGDLLDRSIVISLLRVAGYRDEREFWTAFRAARPKILGALLQAVAGGLRQLPEVNLNPKPRMADFGVWGTAIERPVGWEAGAFMRAYSQNRTLANDIGIDASPFGTAVEKLIAERGKFEGTATVLLKELWSITDEKTRSQRNWPDSGHKLRNAIKRLIPNLRMNGIDVQLGERDKTRMRNRIIRVAKVSSASSEPSNIPEKPQTEPVAETKTADTSVGSDDTLGVLSDGNSLKSRCLDGADDTDSCPRAPDAGSDDIEVEL
jgi:hypothetical protein